RTRFVGHRQLPWIQLDAPVSCCHSRPHEGRTRNLELLSRFISSRFWIDLLPRIVRNDKATGLVRAQLTLALDDFCCELEVGVAADAFEIIDQHRLAVGRRLR